MASTNRWRTATVFVARPGLSSPVVSEDEKKQIDPPQPAFFRALISEAAKPVIATGFTTSQARA
ncbi:MAG: hypothetical protein FWC38_06755 [Proteobacteria bacterium]|nr:hypothetical protein [Pseudomonadota bacterium]MCL2307903.1 hypothetical protein [Pseudomonadota bacterium]